MIEGHCDNQLYGNLTLLQIQTLLYIEHKLPHKFCSALNLDGKNNPLDLQVFVHNTYTTLYLSATDVAYVVSQHHYKADEGFPICICHVLPTISLTRVFKFYSL